MHFLPEKVRATGLSYPAYRQLATQMIHEGRTTASLAPQPGVVDTPSLLEYAHLNEQRMNRIEKTFRLDEAVAELLYSIKHPVEGWVLTESWCGDAAQILPVLHHLSLLNPLLSFRFLLRDQHLDIMDAFLTNGGRAIPKVIFAEPDTLRVLNTWGPRPAAAQRLMQEFKATMLAAPDKTAKDELYEKAKTAVHTWYAHDKTLNTQREALETILQNQVTQKM